MSAMAMTAGHPSQLLMLCCVCGITIEQNAANMCISCVRNTVDITAEISKKCTIHSCRSCQRWLAPPWQAMNLESKELMTVCLRKVTGLSKVKLIDAVWIWTEPHSLRLKIKLTVQREVVNNAVLQQAAVVEFIIRNQQCKACEASYAQGNWHAVVQVCTVQCVSLIPCTMYPYTLLRRAVQPTYRFLESHQQQPPPCCMMY
jgi:nonsense-mediated mRNA decay protein 3